MLWLSLVPAWLLVLIVSIALVAVLVLNSLIATYLLIGDLIHGGKETNSASALLIAGSVVWASNTSRSRCSTGSSTAAAPPNGRTPGRADESTSPSRRT